jgi:hypothetical protein
MRPYNFNGIVSIDVAQFSIYCLGAVLSSALLSNIVALNAAGPNDLKPYSPPIGVSMHPILAVSLTSVGLALLGLLVTYAHLSSFSSLHPQIDRMNRQFSSNNWISNFSSNKLHRRDPDAVHFFSC